jgi:hypothetical protein
VVSSFLQVSQLNFLTHFSCLPLVLYCPPIITT